MKIVICTLKTWNIKWAEEFACKYKEEHEITIIIEKQNLEMHILERIRPDYIFFPHWSYIIPEEIYYKFNCIIFHMTDLPYGRGGSPLQNLIASGKEETVISAVKAVEKLDAGPVYMKHPLCLHGNAEEIFIRAGKIIFEKMIPAIIEGEIEPKEQTGEIFVFKRRKPEDGEIKESMNLEEAYDYIRMLDAEGYPKSYITYGKLKLSFSRASRKNGKILADVEIEEDMNEQSTGGCSTSG